MNEYIVKIERDGRMVFIGRISGDDSGSARFSYDPAYLDSENPRPVSIGLPLQKAAFTAAETETFFDGLLPEGFTRKTIASRLHLDERDYLSILAKLGRECLGAVQIEAPGDGAVASYEKIDMAQLKALAQEGVSKSAEIVMNTHLSLTGASGKVGLYYDPASRAWYLPKGTAPSTHIVKQSHVRLNRIVLNEQLCLMTAQKCGITVPESFIIDTGGGSEEEILFATKRYDRAVSEKGRIVDGLRCPLRLHQEDFAQAMGIPASEKYETGHDNYLKRMFDLLRNNSADPIRDQLKLWEIIVFNYLIGNTDAHVKNFSLLYDPTLRSVHLAPSYDIVSTAVYESSTRNMAFRIGGDLLLDDIRRDSFRRAAAEAGIGERMAMKYFDEMADRFLPALHESAAALGELGFKDAGLLEQKILQSGGIAACS